MSKKKPWIHPLTDVYYGGRLVAVVTRDRRGWRRTWYNYSVTLVNARNGDTKVISLATFNKYYGEWDTLLRMTEDWSL